MTFYLKYRPKALSELDSESVRESLTKICTSGKIPHAILFSGPKGIGKTSAARILAKILNCEKPPKKGVACNKCRTCQSIAEGSNIDVIELDAASHRGIEDVRALRDAVRLSAAKSPNKVYIIDEAHMLTSEASNALLKTLEEPPSHVYFILATTNPEKLIETIRSRTINVSFKKANSDELVRSLQRVVNGEGLKIDEETLLAIARASDGSFRDATKILEQLVSEGRKLAKDEVEEFLFQKKSLDIDSFLKTLSARDAKAGLAEIERIVTAGVEVSNLLESTLERLREGLVVLVGGEGEGLPGWSKKEIISLIKILHSTLREMVGAPLEQLPMEVAIVEWCEGAFTQASTQRPIASPSYQTRTEDSQSLPPDITEDKLSAPNFPPPIPANSKDDAPRSSAQVVSEVTEEVWKRILAAIRPINTSIEALLRAARPMQFDGKTLILGVFYRFHKERLEDVGHRRVLEDVVTNIMGSPIRVICTLTAPPVKNPVEEKREEIVLTEGEDPDIMKAAKEIFGT